MRKTNSTMKRIKKLSILIICILAVYLFYKIDIRERLNIMQGNKVILEIEEYINENGESPQEIELVVSDQSLGKKFEYIKVDSVNYILYFGKSLGESKLYYSDTDQWEDVYRKIE